MKILIYGTGGIGGYFGGRLANAGNSVSFIARGNHLQAIKKNGLQVESILGDFTVHPRLVTNDIKEVEPPDVVILGVKAWQITRTAMELRSIITKNTMVLPLQNGGGYVEDMLKVLPKENVLGGLCHIVSFIPAPGKIKHKGLEPSITFGELDNTVSRRIQDLQNTFLAAGIHSVIPEDIILEIWKKLLFSTSVSALGGLTRVSIGTMRERPFLKDLMKKTSVEVKNVANGKGIAIKDDHIKKVFEIIDNLDFQTTSSTQRDILEGKPSELENLNGYIVKEGTRLGISTPVNLFIYECLLPLEIEARKRLETN